MTVQELIDELEKVEDKSKPVAHDGAEYTYELETVEEDSDQVLIN